MCFANPGTTEMPLVEAFDVVPGVRPVLCLAEGVATGAADGYARMTGGPGLTLLHLGPGFANGIANLHNARRALSPVVNLVGEHATWHQWADAPLASDIDSLARPVSGWVGRTSSTEAAADDFAAAVQAARTQRLPATLIAAADHMWGEGAPGPAEVLSPPPAPQVDEERVAAVAKAVSAGSRTALLLSGPALSAAGLELAAGISAATGCRLFAERSPARAERGGGLPDAPALPYFPEDVLRVLDGFSELVLVGARSPVAFFGYPGLPSSLVPQGTREQALALPEDDVLDALARVAERTGTARAQRPTSPRLEAPEGTLDDAALAASIAVTQPEGAVIVNEAVTSSAAYAGLSAGADRHTELTLTGGAIGMGIPAATGAATACPDRPVIDIQADGSGLYTLQALWTQAREGLNVTTVICSNRRYRILDVELHRAGVGEPGPAAAGLTGLDEPRIEWPALAAGFGVPAERATTGEELTRALRTALAEPGPHLIEAVLP